jgi:hypothetical protein
MHTTFFIKIIQRNLTMRTQRSIRSHYTRDSCRDTYKLDEGVDMSGPYVLTSHQRISSKNYRHHQAAPTTNREYQLVRKTFSMHHCAHSKNHRRHQPQTIFRTGILALTLSGLASIPPQHRTAPPPCASPSSCVRHRDHIVWPTMTIKRAALDSHLARHNYSPVWILSRNLIMRLLC